MDSFTRWIARTKAWGLGMAGGLLLMMWPSQVTAQLPQEAQWAMESAMTRLESQGSVATKAGLAQIVGQAKIDAFLDGAVARLTLEADGSFRSHVNAGGELLSFKLGKKDVEILEPAAEANGGMESQGIFPMPKKKAKLTLRLRAGSRDVSVECFNPYKKSKESVTYYVGPLNGLFCMGMTG
ncbi:MAG: hypothetical protein AAF690_22980 [Acidobacteriota bacterium]